MLLCPSEKGRHNVLIVGNLIANPSSKAFLKKFTNIIGEIGNNIFVVSADEPSHYDNLEWFELRLKHKKSPFDRIFSFLFTQIRLIKILISHSKTYDISVILPTSFFIPLLILRMFNKKVILYVDGKPNSKLLTFFCHIGFVFANLLVVESTNVINEWNIHKYTKKISLCPQYVDETNFKNENDIKTRCDIVGYVGGLTENKGVKEFLQAISILNSKQVNINYVIGGVGVLEEMVNNCCNIYDNVEFKGLINHENELPLVLNEIKLLVLPSFSEGLPNIILESMSCGTPVLATSVGGIPDVIINGETGFIMENNSSECIANNIVKALNQPHLEEITFNALSLINQKYRFKTCVKRYLEIFENLC